MKINNYLDNILDKDFYTNIPEKHLLTDITYIYYGPSKELAYLSFIKDSVSRKIMAYKLSKTLDVDFVLETVKTLIVKHKSIFNKDTFIHSDQGCHYTSISYQELIKELEIHQSMSRRGNCWDNAPHESFYDHMKEAESTNVQSTSI